MFYINIVWGVKKLRPAVDGPKGDEPGTFEACGRGICLDDA